MTPTPHKSVLLVDDEKAYTDLMAQMIEDHLDCRVSTFTHPVDALKALAETRPAVIVTDYHMPEVNGLDFIRQASAVIPTASFVLMTGHNLDGSESELARLTSLRGFLAKPFSWRTLADEIVRVWPSHSSPPGYRIQKAEA